MSELELVDRAAHELRARGFTKPGLSLVLGSGAKSFASRIDVEVRIPFAEVAGWPVPRVEGHGGEVVQGRVAGLLVHCLTGRVHAYEGWTAAEVARPVRTLARLGAPCTLLTNAAGGIQDGLVPGDLMVIEDHLNLTGTSPLIGAHEEPLGPRFPDQSAVFDEALRADLRACDPGLKRGVYAGVLGPSYETPAEIRMLQTLGGDAVGMSTVHEAIALNAMGVRVGCLSLISTLAAGLSDQELRHEDVLAAGVAAEERIGRVLEAFCGRLIAAERR